MKYCEKINLKIEPPNVKRLKTVIGNYGRLTKDGPGAAIRKYLPRSITSKMKGALPPSLQDKVIYISFSEIHMLGPHTHIIEHCVVNYYMSTNGAVTAFYEGDMVIDDVTADNGNGYYTVKPEYLTEAERFIAQPGDAWVLNTRQPHAVFYDGDENKAGKDSWLPVDDTYREVIQIYLDATFEEIVEAFNGK